MTDELFLPSAAPEQTIFTYNSRARGIDGRGGILKALNPILFYTSISPRCRHMQTHQRKITLLNISSLPFKTPPFLGSAQQQSDTLNIEGARKTHTRLANHRGTKSCFLLRRRAAPPTTSPPDNLNPYFTLLFTVTAFPGCLQDHSAFLNI